MKFIQFWWPNDVGKSKIYGKMEVMLKEKEKTRCDNFLQKNVFYVTKQWIFPIHRDCLPNLSNSSFVSL